MVFGGTTVERIALSELTAWSGAPATGEVNPGALPHLHEIRELFFAGKYDEAQALCREYLPGHSKNFGTNLPLPELQLTFETIDSVADYRRSLDLDEAVAHVNYRSGGVSFAREILATHADNLLAMRLTASQPGRIGFRMGFSKGVLPSTTGVSGNATLVLDGHCYESQHSSGHDGVAVQIRAQVILEGGNAAAGTGTIEVRDANAVTILLAIGTSYHDADPEELCKRALSNGARKSFAQIRETHIADYQPLYRRMSLSLGESPSATRQLPTDARRKALENGANDPELLALFFQYGRYLTIAARARTRRCRWRFRASGTMGWQAAWNGPTIIISTSTPNRTTGRRRSAIYRSAKRHSLD